MRRYSMLAAAAAMAMATAARPAFGVQAQIAPASPREVATDKARRAEIRARQRAARKPTRFDEMRIAAAAQKRARKAAKRELDFATSRAGYYFARRV